MATLFVLFVLFVIAGCARVIVITRLLDGDRRALRAEVQGQRALEGKLGVMEQAFAVATEPASNMLEAGEELPDHQIQAWTPQEREAFGINDTIKLIDRIDRELRVVEQAETAKAAREGRLQATTPTPRIPDSDYEVTELFAHGRAEPIRRYTTGGII